MGTFFVIVIIVLAFAAVPMLGRYLILATEARIAAEEAARRRAKGEPDEKPAEDDDKP